MLKGLYFVSESGNLISYVLLDENVPTEEHLFSAFVTALEGFSKETLGSHFKGMRFEREKIIVHFNRVYTIGIFTDDELDSAANRVLALANEHFIEMFGNEIDSHHFIDASPHIMPILEKSSTVKVSPRRIGLFVGLMTIACLVILMFPKLFQSEGILLVLFLLLGLAGGFMIPQRWWATLLASILVNPPAFLLIYNGFTFFYADYFAVYFIFIFVMVSFILDRKKISKTPVPHIPFISNIF